MENEINIQQEEKRHREFWRELGVDPDSPEQVKRAVLDTRAGQRNSANLIHENLTAMGHVDMDPRHVEAWMRSEYRTFDALSPARFAAAVANAAGCVLECGLDLSERLAESYGL